MCVCFSVHLLLLCIIAFVTCMVLVRKNEVSIFSNSCTRNANPGLLNVWAMSVFIFTVQTNQERILINYFSTFSVVGERFYSFVSCSVTVIFRNNSKVHRERIKMQWWCFQTELIRRCVWRGCRCVCTSFCTLLHLLPRCLCSLRFRSSIIWWLCGREGHVCLSCIMQESPLRQRHRHRRVVYQLLKGVRLVLWWVSVTWGICSDIPWSQCSRSWLGVFFTGLEHSIFCPSLAVALLQCILIQGEFWSASTVLGWVGCKHKLECFPKQNSSLDLCLFWARLCQVVWTWLKRASAAGVAARQSFLLYAWVELGVQVASHSTGLLVRIQLWSKRKLHACCF